MHERLSTWLLASLLLCGCAKQHAPASASDYHARRQAYRTQLSARGPLARPYEPLELPADAEEVAYRSQELTLRALLMHPQQTDSETARRPALIYFHGDFSLHAHDLQWCRTFVDAGFVVMTPMLRAENGNPGGFELLWGEVEDARAAARWLSRRPDVDPQRVYALGHSVGGAVAALLSLYDEPKLTATASIGGIYVPSTFARWAQRPRDRDLIRFDPNHREETELRVLGPHTAAMRRPHVAFIGRRDRFFIKHARAVQARAQEVDAPFTWSLVEGDHMSSVPHGMAAYLEWIRHDERTRSRTIAH